MVGYWLRFFACLWTETESTILISHFCFNPNPGQGGVLEAAVSRSGRGGEGRTFDVAAGIVRAGRGFRRETRQPEHGVAHGDTGCGGEEKEHRENCQEVVGFHQKQAQDDSMAEEERRRRRVTELYKLSHRQCTGSAYGVSGMAACLTESRFPISPTLDFSNLFALK